MKGENAKLELARRYVEQTGVSLFLTGKAGTGKTTFLRDIAAHCPKRHVVVAPTGVAAVNAGGMTIHSFFQLPFDPYLPDIKELVTEYQMPESRRSLSKTKLDIIRTLELLIIDEISMVRADLLDAIDMTLRRYRRSSRPFGGVQLLMIGDVHQLAPVVTEGEREYMRRVYPSPFFFHSKALQQIPYVTIELTTVYRQQDADFVELLNRVRDNCMDAQTLAALNSRCGVPQKDAITLTTHNYQADAINSRHMAELTGERKCLEAVVAGNYPDSMAPVDRNLEIKVGERVMFVKNDSSGGRRYYNGKLATVTGFLKEDDYDIVEVIDDDGDVINVGREQWENLRYEVDPKDNQITQEVDGTFSQYPLRAAWAVTIHKAQGLTFDKVAVNAADAFAFGQVYVALSRCRTLEGLTLTAPLTIGVTMGDADVQHFCDMQPAYEQVEAVAGQYEAQYYMEQLADLFSMDSMQVEANRLLTTYGKIKAIYPKQYDAMSALVGHVAELASVGERFRNQLARLPKEEHAERVAKGAEYFNTQLSALTSALAVLLDVEVDNKENASQLKEDGDALSQRIGIKLACMKVVIRDGFSVVAVQKAKADYILAKKEGSRKRGQRKALPPKPRGKNREAKEEKGVREKGEPVEKLLRDWRTEKAYEMDVPPYHILNQKTITALIERMPHTEEELLAVPGIGKTKMELFGSEILDILASAQ